MDISADTFRTPFLTFTPSIWQQFDTMAVQAISGVSASSEAVVMTEYPSLASSGIGQLLGSLYESCPVRPFGLMKLSHVFALLTAPIGLPLYFLQKAFGERYVLTNRNVQVWTARRTRMVSSVALADIADVELQQRPGQVFYQASDIHLKSAGGETTLILKGVKDAGSFRNAIARTIDSRRLVQESMDQIAARS